ncbi:MAG: MAPEG family protein [Silicimonas sp.]|nr:MAPEG family protein [Silicimonas sp.]
MIFGGGLGVLWALAVVVLPGQGPQPFIPVNLALIYAFAPGGLVLALMIGAMATRRFFADDILDGNPPLAGSRADIDQRVLRNTVEQLVLALCLWPFAAMQLGAVTLITLGVSFAIARLLFWAGYHIAPPMRALGFAASFYPTIFAAIWCLWRLAT